jgi:SAM-dependent methyltransferase
MTIAAEKEYLLGTRDDELARLGFQHRVWAAATFQLWEDAGFGPGQTILDLGCGPGFATLDLAWLVGPRGHVIALDESMRFLERLRATRDALGLSWVEPVAGDVQRLELAPASLDGAYARWVLCFTPEPARVIEGVARALRPGGAFVVMDYFRYSNMALSPRTPSLKRVAHAVEESWRRAGGDLDVAGRLPGLMTAAGLEVREFRPIVRLARPGSALWHWPTLFFKTYVPRLVEMGLLSPAERASFERDWEKASRDPLAFFTTPPIYGVIGVRPGGAAM